MIFIYKLKLILLMGEEGALAPFFILICYMGVSYR